MSWRHHRVDNRIRVGSDLMGQVMTSCMMLACSGHLVRVQTTWWPGRVRNGQVTRSRTRGPWGALRRPKRRRSAPL